MLAKLSTEKLVISGSLEAADFPAWIVHRARKLGLRGRILRVDDHTIETLVAGPSELIDAMEVGCSLGPTSVRVERIDRFPVDFDIADASFAYIPAD